MGSKYTILKRRNESTKTVEKYSCAYENCNFACSVENIEKIENHLEECQYTLVYCSNKGCLHKTSRYLMQNHSAECRYAFEKCPYGNCSVELQRREMSLHRQKCPYRTIVCKNEPYGCNTTVAFKDLEKHLETCPLRPNPCKMCGEPLTSQSLHICPLETEKCPHCDKEFIIKDFENHQNSCLTKCTLCEKYFPNSDIRHHKCRFRKCGHQFCDYKDLHWRIQQHMDGCEFQLIKCTFCNEYFQLKDRNLHTSECKKARQLCGYQPNIEMMTCNRNTEQVQTDSTGSQRDTDVQAENSKICVALDNYNFPNAAPKRLKTKNAGQEISRSTTPKHSFLFEEVTHIDIHDRLDVTMNINAPKFSDCRDSLNLFREILRKIDKNPSLQEEVRKGKHYGLRISK